MFKHDRSYQTTEQRSLAIKSISSTKLPQTCAQKYSSYASINNGGGGGSSRTIANCTKSQNVYVRGKLIGKNYCVRL